MRKKVYLKFEPLPQSRYFLNVLGGYTKLGIYHNEEFWYRQITVEMAALISINTKNLWSDWIIINAHSKVEALKIIRSEYGVTSYNPLVGYIILNIQYETSDMRNLVNAIDSATQELLKTKEALTFKDAQNFIIQKCNDAWQFYYSKIEKSLI